MVRTIRGIYERQLSTWSKTKRLTVRNFSIAASRWRNSLRDKCMVTVVKPFLLCLINPNVDKGIAVFLLISALLAFLIDVLSN